MILIKFIHAFTLLAICGDGLIFGDEDCDDGVQPASSGDGCSDTCTNETGWSCPYDGTKSNCTRMLRDDCFCDLLILFSFD
jgi:cysteine-rich repeat protein